MRIMKKISVLAVLMIMVSMTFGQITNSQLPSCTFESWNATGSPALPTRWHSYSDMDCELDAATCEAAEIAGAFLDHHKKVAGRTGFGCQLYSVTKHNRILNGALTTGKSRIASIQITDTINYVYTQREGNCHWEFSCRPDSIALWARFSFLQNSYPTAPLRVQIHGDVDFVDMPNTTTSTPQEGKIANVMGTMTNPATTPVNGVYKSDWTRFAFKFNYWDANNNLITTPTLQNTAQPYYALVSLSTNTRLGYGENDSLTIDDIFCIYDKGLASLKIDGVEHDLLRETFNTYEYYTHGNVVNGQLNNSGSITLNDTSRRCFTSSGDLPQVTIEPKSSLILNYTITQATVVTPRCTITVMHNDSSTFTYVIRFNNIKPKPTLNLTYSNNQHSACEGTPISVTATGTSSAGPLQYSWSDGTIGNVFQPTTPGIYDVTATVTDANNCSSSAPAHVEIFPKPNITISGSNTICSGKTATLTAAGATTYQWSDGSITASIVATTGGEYSVTGTSNGCTNTATHVLTVQPTPVVSISGPDALCSGTTATLTASGANTYIWNNGHDEADLTIASSGTYSVTGTNSFGCSSSATQDVSNLQTPTVNIIGDTLVCEGSSITLTASNLLTGTTLLWSNSSTSNTITVNSQGTYTVTATLNNCQATASHSVIFSSKPNNPTVTPGSRCGSGPITLTASTPSENTLLWYASATTQNIAGTGQSFTINNLQSTTTYYVCAVNEAGCTSSRVPVQATIFSGPTPPTVSNNTSYCGAGNYTLTATTTSPNTVQWYSDNDGMNIIPATQNITQTTTYYAASIDNNQCRSALVPMTVTINDIPAQPTVSTNPTSPICSNSSVTVTFNATAPAGHVVKWYDGNMQSAGQGNQMSKSVSGNNTFYASVYNNNTQCESDKTPIAIVIYPIPSAPTVSIESVCGESDLVLPTQGNTITWYSDQSGNNQISVNQHITQTSTFYAAVTDDNNCRSAVVPVTAIVKPTYNTSFYQTACMSYTWNNETFTNSGVYTRTFQTVLGCDSVVTMNLTINPAKSYSFDTTVCEQFVWMNQTYTTSQTIVKTLTSSDNCDSIVTCYLTVLSPTYSTQTLPLCSNQLPYEYKGINIVGPGTIIITTTNAAGCDSIITVTVTINSTPATPNITSNDTSRCGSGNLTLNIPAGMYGNTCRWYNTATGGNPIFTGTSFTNNYTENTVFYISSYNTNTGCESSRVPMQVTVNPVPSIPMIDDYARCGAGLTTLNAFIDMNATTCRWYSNNSASSEPFHVGLTYSSHISNTTYYYVESYNANTKCKSTRKPVTVTINPVPATPQVSDVTNCGPLTADFSTYITANSSQLYRWYNSNNMLLAQNAHYNATVEESTTILVSNYNAQTTCESGKSSLVITINPSYDPQHIFDTVCQNTHYQEHGIDEFLNTPGEFQFVINQTASTSCDSLVTLHVRVNPVIRDTVTIDTCDLYTLNGTTYQSSGIYTQSFTAANGCDSVIVLDLTLHSSYQNTFSRMICEGGSIVFNGQTITEAGTYTANLTSVYGCDSTVTLMLSTGSTYLDTITAHVCYGESYHQYGFDVEMATQTMFISHDTVSASNCDSTTVLHLIVHDFDTTFISATRCFGNDYNEFGFQVPADTVGEFVFTRVIPTSFCDSTVILNLTINPVDLEVFSDEICQGDTYNAHGFDTTFTEAGSFVLMHSASNVFGCDSTVVINLTVHPTYHLPLNESICEGEHYDFNNQEIYVAGTYTDTLSSVHGCDSIVTLHLTVNPTFSHDTTVDICDNDLPFLWNGDSQYSFWESDDYDIAFLTADGCDSVIHLHLNVNPTYVQDTNVSVCQGSLPYLFDESHSFSQAGTYTVNLLTENGCDSIWTLHLAVTPNIEHAASKTICDNELPFTFMGETFSAAGTYDITETGDDDCLTITHFTLVVKPTFHHFDTVTVCQEELPFYYGDSILAQAGSYDIHFSSEHSCDSLVSLLLNVIPTAQGTMTQFVCTSDFPFSYGGETFNAAGVYSVTFHRPELCDSVVTLTLIEAPETLVVDSAVVCDHELPFLWRGGEYTLGGIFYDSLVSVHGCDSVFALVLTVNPTQVVFDDDILLCQGDSTIWRGLPLYEAGVYRDTVPSINGCREIHQVAVVVNPSYLFHDSVTVCSDDLPYLWRGMTLHEAGVREDFHQTEGSFCDSIYRLTLFVNASYHATETAAVCDYELPYLWHGLALSESGTYYDTLVSAEGCDSTFTLLFSVNSSLHEILADTICQNALPYAWRGHAINDAGFYADTLPNDAGCLDIFELHLYVIPADVTTIFDTVCAGTLYQLHGFDTLALMPGTLYASHSLTNSNGCDSTVNLVLTVSQSYLFETFAETCENVPYEWRGGEFLTEGSYFDSLVSSLGCDSVFVLHLSINPTFDIFVSDSAVREHEYAYGNFVVTPADSGTFEYDIQYYTLAGCDSVVHLTLYVAFNEGVEEFTMTPEFKFFPNPTSAMLNIRGERMTRIEVFALNGKLVFRGTPDTPESTAIDVSRFAAGHYSVRVTLDDGKSVSGKIIINRR